ncbi:hypothetical protein N2152v2_009539 [Parachlorella kessleri]
MQVLLQSTANLATTIIGAGIMALPRTFATLGILLGATMMGLVFGLSYFSLFGLVRVSGLTRQWTYADLVRSQFGRAGGLLLQLSIVLNNAGTMVVYLIIIGDILAGVAPDYNGLISMLLGPGHAGQWYTGRAFVVGMLCLLCLAPLVSLRDLSLLGPMSTVGVSIAGAFAASVVALTGVAFAKGQVGDFHWLPSLDMLGTTPSKVALNLLAVLPVITMCFVCHYNVHPIAHSLARFTNRRMMMVVRRALTLCSTLFTLVAAGGYMLFGSDTQENILNNFVPGTLAHLVGPVPANILSFAIRLGYCICLMATFALLNWALRETVAQLAFGRTHLSTAGFLLTSYVLLLVLYLVSILVPSVWTALSLTGATAAVLVAFILPGALILKTERRRPLYRALAWVCVLLGVAMGVVGVANVLISK